MRSLTFHCWMKHNNFHNGGGETHDWIDRIIRLLNIKILKLGNAHRFLTENLILQRLHYSFHDQIAFTTGFHIACCIPQKQHGIHNNHVQWHLKSVNGKAETIMCYYHYYYYIILLLLNNGHAPKLINIILLCYGSEAAELFIHYH